MKAKYANWTGVKVIGMLVVLLICYPAFGVTLEELRNTPNLTPQRFARFFSDFELKERAAVQSPEDFLMSQSGDCDDYATLAAMVLSEKGYTVRLISVRMPKATHVVAYVEQTKSYLDFNNRFFLIKMVGAKENLEAIAAKVSGSFQSEWSSASEFTYAEGVKRMVATVNPNGKIISTATVVLARFTR